MNYKNNLSLILASTMVSGMFSAAVNAAAYKFTTKDSNLEAYAVTTTDSKNVVSSIGEGSASIDLALSASGTKSQKFVFGVSSEFSDTASGGLNAAEETLVKELKNKAATAITALKAINAQAQVVNVANHARTFRDAVEVMAEIKGKMSDKSNAQELVPAVKDLTQAFAKAYAVSSGTQAVVANNTFAASALPEGEKDAANLNGRLSRVLSHENTGAAQVVTTPVTVGICVGDVITDGMPDGDRKKYQVLGSQAHDINTANTITAAAAGQTNIANCVRIDDGYLVMAAGGTVGVRDVNAAHIDTAAFTNVNGGVTVGTFLLNRDGGATPGSADGAAAANCRRIIANGTTALQQLQNFNGWMNNYFMYRAKAFLTTVEGMESGAVASTWLGAGAVKTSNLNKAGDYTVTVAFKKNANAVSVRKITEDKVFLGGTNGATITPLMVEFVANTATKDTPIEGTLKIAGGKAVQEIPFSGTVSKNDSIEIDTAVEQTVPNGFTFAKDAVSSIRSADTEDFIINVLPTGTKVDKPVSITLAKSKTMKTGAQKVTAEISEDDNANALYAAEDKNGKKSNDVAIFTTGSISTGKVEYGIPVEAAKEELGELDNGARVYVYLTTAEKLEATKAKKAEAKKAEAAASANDGAVDSTKVIEGKVVDGKIVFTEDPSKITREDGEVFMISKNKLNIEDAEEASAAEDEEEEEEAEDEEAEEEEAEGEEAATEGAAVAATAGNDALTTEGTAVDEVTANEVPTNGVEEVTANAANGVAATGATAAAGLFGTMALASLAAGALATKKNKK